MTDPHRRGDASDDDDRHGDALHELAGYVPDHLAQQGGVCRRLLVVALPPRYKPDGTGRSPSGERTSSLALRTSGPTVEEEKAERTAARYASGPAGAVT